MFARLIGRNRDHSVGRGSLNRDVGDDGAGVSRRRQFITSVLMLAWATGLGLFVAVLDGRQERVSVEVWLVVGGGLVVAELVWRLLGAAGRRSKLIAPGAGDDVGWLRQWGEAVKRRLPDTNAVSSFLGGDDQATSPMPPELRSLDNLLSVSTGSGQHFNRRLQPRLRALAYHYLPQRHGIDPSNGDEVARVLGDLGWMIDSGRALDRSSDVGPTFDELARFLTVILNEDQVMT